MEFSADNSLRAAVAKRDDNDYYTFMNRGDTIE
jgi:hypothetical protein